ncbi:hypothetical protein M426DRAFT_326240 [Hypoxylon sp. CI-4A]|nr:hypothetical protein M426DRAFT_326240 [Hypoxylon sp. CI-4A]
MLTPGKEGADERRRPDALLRRVRSVDLAFLTTPQPSDWLYYVDAWSDVAFCLTATLPSTQALRVLLRRYDDCAKGRKVAAPGCHFYKELDTWFFEGWRRASLTRWVDDKDSEPEQLFPRLRRLELVRIGSMCSTALPKPLATMGGFGLKRSRGEDEWKLSKHKY